MVGAYRQTYRNVIGAFGELPPGGEAFVKLIAGRAAQSWEANTGLDADGGAAGAITARLKSSQEADRADDRQGERRGEDSRRRICAHRADAEARGDGGALLGLRGERRAGPRRC